ncbi:MAG: sensor histidine kinase [Lachnospiraceae bacterium]|nr:sensor histidine kinase [Lachnospiraceae bacterium]
MTWFILLIGMIIVIVVFLYRTKVEMERHDMEMIKAMNHSISEGYALLADKNDELREQAHNFRNHLLTLREMDKQEADAYIDDLLDRQISFSYCHSGNRYLDAVLNSRIPVIKENGIAFYHNIRMPEIAGISPTDLCTIACNQLDNAIEACLKISRPEDRWIRFSVDQGGDMLSIVCENSIVPGSVTQDSLKTSSKKEDQHLHGFGIRSIETCAERLNGIVIHEIEETSFRSKVTLSLMESSS